MSLYATGIDLGDCEMKHFRDAKRIYITKIWQLTNTRTPAYWWKTIKSIIMPNKIQTISPLNYNGIIVSDNLDKTSVFVKQSLKDGENENVPLLLDLSGGSTLNLHLRKSSGF